MHASVSAKSVHYTSKSVNSYSTLLFCVLLFNFLTWLSAKKEYFFLLISSVIEKPYHSHFHIWEWPDVFATKKISTNVQGNRFSSIPVMDGSHSGQCRLILSSFQISQHWPLCEPSITGTHDIFTVMYIIPALRLNWCICI